MSEEKLMCLAAQSFQTARLEGLLDSLYKEPESLPEQEVTPTGNISFQWLNSYLQVRFAELLDQKLERAEVIQSNIFELNLTAIMDKVRKYLCKFPLSCTLKA